MIGRRDLLKVTGGLVAAQALVPAPAMARALFREVPSLDPVTTAMRMRGSADGALTMSYLDAVREIMLDGEITPFCKLQAFVVARYVPVGDVFEAQIIEVAYYTDFETNEQLTSFKFPGQTEAVSVPKYRTGPIKVRFANTLDEWEDVNPGKAGEASANFAPRSRVRLQRSVKTPTIEGDKLFIRTNEYGRAYVNGAKSPSVFYREWIIYEAETSDIYASDAPSIPATYSYSAMSSFRPWMKLEGRTGHTAENGRGRKIWSPAELPPEIYSLVEKHDPDLLKEPEAALSRTLAR